MCVMIVRSILRWETNLIGCAYNSESASGRVCVRLSDSCVCAYFAAIQVCRCLKLYIAWNSRESHAHQPRGGSKLSYAVCEWHVL